MYEDWGLNKLYERLEHERDEETQHADWLIKRILFLEGVPDLTKRRALLVGGNVKEMMPTTLSLSLRLYSVKETIKICEEEQDYQSREVLEKLLFDTEEDHVYWLEQQLGLIEKIGIQNYQQSQMGESEA